MKSPSPSARAARVRRSSGADRRTDCRRASTAARPVAMRASRAMTAHARCTRSVTARYGTAARAVPTAFWSDGIGAMTARSPPSTASRTWAFGPLAARAERAGPEPATRRPAVSYTPMTGCDKDWRGRLTGPPGMVSGTTAAARAASRWRAVTASVRYSRCTATPRGRANRITASAVTARIDTRTRRRSGTPLGTGFIGKRYFTWRSGGADPRAHSIRPMRIASTVTRRLVVLAAAGLCASACSSGPASTPAPQAASATGASSSTAASSPTGAAPAGTETPPPGDIPDTTAYVAFRPSSRQYEVKVPEGWARTIAPTVVFFTDKLNVVSIYTVKAAAPTVASARA